MSIKQIIFKTLRSCARLIPPEYKYNISLKVKRMLFSKKEIIAYSGIKYIDKPKIDKKITDSANIFGVTSVKRTPKLIVSLTSYPERMDDIKYALFSLLNQTLKPDEVILWLSYEEFPEKEAGISEEILSFKENGLAIKFCHNLKPYKKLIPALKEYPDCIIVTADDDNYYDNDWLEKLYTSYEKSPEYIQCHRAHKVTLKKNKSLAEYESWQMSISCKQTSPSFLNFFTGVGGVLYPPGSLYKDTLNEKLFLKLCPTADDIWFWAMAVLQGTKINVVNNNIAELVSVNPERELGLINCTKLTTVNVIRKQNDNQLKAVFEYYDLCETITLPSIKKN